MKTILFFALFFFFTVFPVTAYFQDRYFCVVNESSIDISLATGDQLCMRYLAGLQSSVDKLSTDIENVKSNARGGQDTQYRETLSLQLEQQKKKIVLTQQTLLTAMKDFEQELFFRIKRVVGYYLMPKYDRLLEKQNQARKLSIRLLTAGAVDQYRYVRGQMDATQRELMFLQNIKEAGEFAELIPPLKWRIQLQDAGGLK